MTTLPPFDYHFTSNDIEISGTVLWCFANDVQVEINSPFCGIQAGLHVPAFAMYPQNRNLDDYGKLTEKGIRTIENCFVIAYNQASFLYSNREVLYNKIIEYEANIGIILDKLDDLKKYFGIEKSERRKLFKEKVINELAYTGFLKLYQTKIENILYQIAVMKRNVFAGFPNYKQRYKSEDQDFLFVKKYYTNSIVGIV